MRYRVLFQTNVTHETFIESDTPEHAEGQVNSDLGDGVLDESKELTSETFTYSVQEVK